MSRKPQYRSKEEERSRFGFEFKRESINYKTEIPALPEKPRHRPDEKALDKKIEDIQRRIEEVKETRRVKKEEIKAVNRAYDERVEHIKKDVELGRKCIDVLYTDLDFLGGDIARVSGKIKAKSLKLEDNSKFIRDLKAKTRAPKRSYKPLEEMSNRELDVERERIEYEMSSRDLSKKEEGELNGLLTKIGRIKADPTRTLVPEPAKVDNTPQIAAAEATGDQLRSELEKHRIQKAQLQSRRDEVDWKIQCIREDLTQFIQELKTIADQEENNEAAKKLYQEKKDLKQKIYDLREEITLAEKEFADKNKEYEYEQEKIRWISWATKIQDQKREEWEAEKAERKRQKLREKGADPKKEGETKEGEGKPQQREERRKINRNQKEIDNCAFLIDYCKRLYPSATQQAVQAEKKAVNLQEELKKGAWAKEKGVQIIQSKKARKDEEEETPRQSRKQNEPEEEQQSSKKFTHDYFVQRFFENAKLLPPTVPEDLEKAIKELEDKVEYYLSHPDEGVESKFEQDRKFVDKHTTNSSKPEGKYTKSKPGSKIINTEDFPSLA